MDEVEKLKQELFDKKLLLTKAQVVRVARFVKRRELEARIDERIKSIRFVGENDKRLAELRKELKELEKE